jgi:very-short-patch-repair endonuclease
VLAGFARRQFGIAPRAELLDVGLTRHNVDYLMRTGRLEQLFLAVYRVAGVPPSWEQMLLAACWAGGVRNVASHRSACAIWSLPGGTEILEVTSPRWRRTRHDGIVTHESRRFDPLDLTIVRGAIPVTRPARTFLDCCSLVERGVIDERTAELVLQEAIRRNLVDVNVVWARWERLGGERRIGGTIAKRLIDRWNPASAKTDSDAEALLLECLRGAGLPGPEPQHRVWFGPDECVDIDFAWPDRRVGIEFDSYRWHGGRIKHDADARRELRLQARGWEIVRITDEELDAGCPFALAALSRLLHPPAA